LKGCGVFGRCVRIGVGGVSERGAVGGFGDVRAHAGGVEGVGVGAQGEAAGVLDNEAREAVAGVVGVLMGQAAGVGNAG